MAVPVYEYRCTSCATVFDLLRAMAERQLDAVCPRCEARSTMPLISAVAAVPQRSSGPAPAAPSASGGCCGGSCGCR